MPDDEKTKPRLEIAHVLFIDIVGYSCQGMLNDPELENYAERYGRNMSVEAGFMEWMRDIAVNKVRLLLSDLVAIPQYQQKMQEERYDFLRTRAAFDLCMERAYKRWKWVSEKLR